MFTSKSRIYVQSNISEVKNGQLPLAERAVRSRISVDVWEQIKTACLFSAPHGNDEIKGSRSVDFRRSGMASVVHPTNANERVAALGVVRALPTFAHVCRFIGEIT